VGDARRIAVIGDQAAETLGETKAPFRVGQQHHAAVRGEAATVEGSCDFLPADGWKIKGRNRIVDHGGRGSL